MESSKIVSPRNSRIAIDATPGHFVTSSSHINYYLDTHSMKMSALVAREVARELAVQYRSNTIVNTIVCMENMEIVGAFLAQELLEEGTMVINSGDDIQIVKPVSHVSGQLIFHAGAKEKIDHQNVILLVSSVTTGEIVFRALECLNYYGSEPVGISAIFSAAQELYGHPIYSVFTAEDIDGYASYAASECPLCRAGRKLDALIGNGGYAKF